MQLPIRDAAAAYGVARSTVYRAIESGRITAARGRNGKRVVDMAELVREWGEPPHPPPGLQTRDTDVSEELRAIREALEALRNEVREHRQLPPPPSVWSALRRRLARWIEP